MQLVASNIIFGASGLLLGVLVATLRRKCKGGIIFDKQHNLDSVIHQQAFGNSEQVQPGDLEDKLWHEAETDFIFKLNESLSLTVQKSKVAQYVIEGVHNFLYAQTSVLFLYDKEIDRLLPAFALGKDKVACNELILNTNEGITGHVFTKKQALLVEDLERESYLKSLNKEVYLNRSFVSVPLIFKGKVLGVLNVCGKKPDRPFTKKDFSFILNIGRAAAISFQSVELHEQIQQDYLTTMTALASALDARDHYTRWHSDNVARYSLAIAKKLEYNSDQLELIRRAALMHDIGKIGISDNILLKPGKLNEEEYTQIKTHSAKGEEIVKSLSFLKEASALIRHHHERYDGNGYPDGLAGDSIEEGACILAVADTFDAMTSDRPYRKGLPLEVARDEIKNCRGGQFKPVVADAFLKILEENPDILHRPE